MSDYISIDDTKDLVKTRLDTSIDDPHSILEVVVHASGDEFYDAFAVLAIQKGDGLIEDAHHRWVLQVHRLKVTIWGDLLQDIIINEYGISDEN